MGFTYHYLFETLRVYMKKVIWHLLTALLITLVMPLTVLSQTVKVPKPPAESLPLLPSLSKEIDRFWPTITNRTFPAGIVDQESNWKVNAHLRTKREHGCGLGQSTIAFNEDGSVRFDALAETKRLDPSLAAWSWRDCVNVTFQLRGMVLKLKAAQRDCQALMSTPDDALKCNAAKYNGGSGSVSKRVRMCRATPGCDPGIWENNLAKQCAQSTVKVAGYGESFCEINSKYPGRVFARMPKFNGLL
jgi:hypothetical protein